MAFKLINVSTNATEDGYGKFSDGDWFSVNSAAVSTAGAETVKVGSDVFSVSGTNYKFITSNGGEYKFYNEGAGTARLAAFDASKSTGIKFEDTVGIAVSLGTAKDEITLKNKGSKVYGYNYVQGDIINVAGGVIAGFANDELTIGTDKVTEIVEVDGFYKAEVVDTTKDTDIIYANAKVGLNNGTYTSGDKAVSIDASANSGSFTFYSGKGDASVSLNPVNDVTYVISKKSGTDSIVGTGFDAKDTIVFESGGSLKDAKFSVNAGAVDIVYDNAKIQNVLVADGGAVKLDFGEGAGLASIGSTTSNGLKYDKDTVYYVGMKDGSYISIDSEEAVEFTAMYDKAENFVNIALVQTAAGGGTYYGWANGETTIIADTAKDKEAVLWGGSKDADKIQVGESKGVDIIRWGSKETDGADIVQGFDAENDILDLYETESLTTSLFKTENRGPAWGVVTVGGALVVEVTPHGRLEGDDVIKMKGKAGQVVKVAVGGLQTDDRVYAAFDTDFIIADGDEKTEVSFAAAKEDDTECKTVNLNDAKFVGDIADVDLRPVKNDVITLGRTDEKSKIAGGQGKNAIWGGTKGSAITLLANDKTDYIWFAEGDGEHEVTGFNTDDDEVYVYNGAEEVDFDITLKGGNIVYEAGDSTLTLKNVTADDQVVVKADAMIKGEVKEYKLAVAAEDAVTGGKIDYAADVNVYIGNSDAAEVKMHTLEIGNKATENLTLALWNDDAEDGIAFRNIHRINGSDAKVELILMGANNGDELTGGKKKNAYWGGSAGAQTMNGNEKAVDYFWFGKGDGMDEVGDISKDDMVFLWNVADINDVKLIGFKEDSAQLFINAEDQLWMQAAGDVAFEKLCQDGLTFATYDGTKVSEYTYDTAEKKFVAKA